eukprot:gnl/MRDRNA2_/MRDRNA2_280048_c0_seq1.p1 gnl/MRDRNA2_/MRDRNA2_280048_c0~~gnl/MRDRNA2_/MRDRNA2_280048_c0_seq1.p1  ORF type:complete len:282 (+),score=26.06 gnl/MRDRNA2_/MRDRNA2_280048_c0_seq1:2-847(+)
MCSDESSDDEVQPRSLERSRSAEASPSAFRHLDVESRSTGRSRSADPLPSGPSGSRDLLLEPCSTNKTGSLEPSSSGSQKSIGFEADATCVESQQPSVESQHSIVTHLSIPSSSVPLKAEKTDSKASMYPFYPPLSHAQSKVSSSAGSGSSQGSDDESEPGQLHRSSPVPTKKVASETPSSRSRKPSSRASSQAKQSRFSIRDSVFAGTPSTGSNQFMEKGRSVSYLLSTTRGYNVFVTYPMPDREMKMNKHVEEDPNVDPFSGLPYWKKMAHLYQASYRL